MKPMNPKKAQSLLGLREGRLSPCPDLANCVVSQYKEPRKFFMQPMVFTGEAAAAIELLEKCVLELGGQIATREKDYMHAIFTSSLFRFIDDVEFFFDKSQEKIHFRSASRRGAYDFGVNKKRISKLTQLFTSYAKTRT